MQYRQMFLHLVLMMMWQDKTKVFQKSDKRELSHQSKKKQLFYLQIYLPTLHNNLDWFLFLCSVL